jgi:enamine deaminase RidA (YjgF/YER057c/UK114 family)
VIEDPDRKEKPMISGTNRRRFLGGGLVLSAGALFPRAARSRGPGAGQGTGPETRIEELGLELPKPPTPVANYVPAVEVGNMLYVSGHGPRKSDGSFIQGKVGAELDLDGGAEAARVTGLGVLSTVRDALGSLDRVVRLVRVFGMVNATPDFDQHPRVINGFSDLMVEVFGETAGKGARCAVGMGSLPFNIAVEIEAFFEIRT